MELFRQRDKVSFNEVIACTTVKNHSFYCQTTAFLNGPKLQIQSLDFSQGVPKFVIIIEENLHFDCYHMGKKLVYHASQE